MQAKDGGGVRRAEKRANVSLDRLEGLRSGRPKSFDLADGKDLIKCAYPTINTDQRPILDPKNTSKTSVSCQLA